MEAAADTLFKVHELVEAYPGGEGGGAWCAVRGRRRASFTPKRAADLSALLAALDFLLPAGTLDMALDIVDKGKVVRLVTRADGAGPSVHVVAPSSRASARRRNAAAGSGGTPYVVQGDSCTCANFANSAMSETAPVALVRAAQRRRNALTHATHSRPRTSQCKHILAVALAHKLATVPLRVVTPETLAYSLVDGFRAPPGASAAV